MFPGYKQAFERVADRLLAIPRAELIHPPAIKLPYSAWVMRNGPRLIAR
jgi:hypothetical protein